MFDDRVDGKVEARVDSLEEKVVVTLDKFQAQQDTRQEKTDLALLQLRIGILEEQISRDEHILRKNPDDEFTRNALANKKRKLEELKRILEIMLFQPRFPTIPAPPTEGDPN